ncbi:MAG: 16S rRNA (guanine(966)-N(2))-methyltransferase RsmD [Actinomycetaceae bacterium]|nr:16S rRNA (guanine(966)-N(2))-methyltransferase RsmD [Actinomycetaceae bacterium]
MTRIVAGSAGGRAIKVPTVHTRPTSERVREAMFSRLEHRGYIADCNVLDLFAGSGALGLEAASRGAAHVELVESSRPAAQLIRQNAANLGLDVQVHTAKAESWVTLPPRREFDLVLLDPPYALEEDVLGQVLSGLMPHMADDALVVVERSKRSPEPQWPDDLELQDHRDWGDTRVWSAAHRPAGTRLES